VTTENDFLLFANTATNIDSQATYVALPAITAGFPSGILASVDLNKVLRQATAGMAVIGAFMQAQSQAAVDNGNLSTLLANFEAALATYIGGTSSFGANGYIKFPGGFIVQWGQVTNSSSSGVVQTFPIAFPNACFGVSNTYYAPTASENASLYYVAQVFTTSTPLTTFGSTLLVNGDSNPVGQLAGGTSFYIALGN
jgi:hypothetical protein